MNRLSYMVILIKRNDSTALNVEAVQRITRSYLFLICPEIRNKECNSSSIPYSLFLI